VESIIQFESERPFAAGSAGTAPRTQPVRGETLTAREIQVLKLMADGLSTKQIATALNVTFKTAASHRSRILSKLGVHETISAVRWAIRGGIVEP
jgi:DNA-binding NarL/FixJ family response regulator